MIKATKERDKITLSFASDELKKPMNELLNTWEAHGYKISTKAVTSLIEMNHLSNSDHYSLVASTYHYIFKNLKKVYGDNQEALYEAVNDVLSKVIHIDTTSLMTELQRKTGEARQANEEAKEIATMNAHSVNAQVNEPVLDTQQMIQAKREMDEAEKLRKQEEARLEQERYEVEQMKQQLEQQMVQVQQFQAQMALMAQMPQMTGFGQGIPQAMPQTNTMNAPQSFPTTTVVEEEESMISDEQVAKGFNTFVNAASMF